VAEQIRIYLRYVMLLLGGVAVSLRAQQAAQPEIEQYSRQAEQALAGKNWEQAAQALEKLSQLAPGVPEVQANLGLAYYSEGRIYEAAQAFERALKLNAKLSKAGPLLGLCLAELGRNQEAVSILEPAFRHPPDPQTGRLIGLDLERAYQGVKQYAKAMAVSDTLLSRYPGDPEILFHAARLHADRSYQLMLELVQGAPNSAWVHYATAEVHESLQHYDLAAAEYRTVLQMEPRLPGVHFRLGRSILLGSREPKALNEALHEFEQELAVAPENSDAEYEMGEIYRQRSQFEPSLEHFSKAVQYQPQFEEAHIGLARALMSLGKDQEALAHLEEAVRLDPLNEVPHFLLVSVYKTLGDRARQQNELDLFQRLHAAGPRTGLRLPGAPSSTESTRQELDLESGR
jgi:tetratricopeptide (TPR) repeat protein